MHWRKQGDLGELSAMEWFASKGALVCFPIGHSPDWDFVAELDRRLVRVQVKSCTAFRNRRWTVSVSTRGGNQSWSGLVKRFDPETSDYLFAVVGDGRRWCIPSRALLGRTGIALGGPRYAEFEVERGSPLPGRVGGEHASTIAS
jgi:PD-(D/E)XK endonuclease